MKNYTRTLFVGLLALLLSIPLVASAGFGGRATLDGPDEFHINIANLDGTHTLQWTAPYDRTLPSGASWTDGDRDAYRCAYMFLLSPQGSVVGRATFIRIPEAASYTMVNDQYMDEGVRFFDGTIDPTPSQHDDCPTTSLEYEPFEGDERPIITFKRTNQAQTVLETRNYETVAAAADMTFQQVEVPGVDVAVVGYKNGNPTVVVYYDSMNTNKVTVESNLS